MGQQYVAVDKALVKQWADETLQYALTGYTDVIEDQQYKIVVGGEDGVFTVESTPPFHALPRRFKVKVTVTEL